MTDIKEGKGGSLVRKETCCKAYLGEAANVIRRTRYDAGGLIYCQCQPSGQRILEQDSGF
jgi:cell fate regulator YaaT (PSP1 superfamily)